MKEGRDFAVAYRDKALNRDNAIAIRQTINYPRELKTRG